MRNVLAVILGGGKGTRLYPLIQYRSKPAVPLGGKYRLIDIPISNCINSDINRIYLLTQFNSVSLHRHIRQTYRFDRFDGGFVEILAAQQTIEGEAWYQGTADAVRKNLRYFEQHGVEQVLILSGDQLYRMNFEEMLATHLTSHADVTIAALPCTREAARGFGIMRLDDTGRVRGFLEKPQTDEEIDLVRTDPKWIDEHGLKSQGRDCLANMGIYLFQKNVLLELLEKSDYHDFGKEVFPMSIRTHRVQVHLYDGYWEDLGTIGSFFQANLDLTKADPPFRLEDPKAPIFTHARSLPPTRCDGATIKQSLLADGCTIGAGSVIENCVIGLRCHIGRNVVLRDVVLMGADYSHTPEHRAEEIAAGKVPIGIGDGTRIEHAILDKNCRIGCNITIRHSGRESGEQPPVIIRDGINVVPKDAVLPDGWTM